MAQGVFMKRVKPKGLTFEQIAHESGISTRTIKRYFAGLNVTLLNSDAIKSAVLKLSGAPRKRSPNDTGDKVVFLASLKIRENVFWSNPKGSLPLKNVVAAVVVGRNISDLISLKKTFGDKAVRKIYMEMSDGKKNHLAGRILNAS